MRGSWVPRILHPGFTWPRSMQPEISQDTPPVPRIQGVASRWVWGFIHKGLYHLLERYCSWFGIPFSVNILQLPFGLILKWTDRTTLEEAIAMQMARAAGMPAPRLLSYGEHPNDLYNRKFSILMTRLSGVSLENSIDPLEVDAEEPWLEELKLCVHSMRLWKPPSQNYISSVIGTSIGSTRVPRHIMGPFQNEKELHQYLLDSASNHTFESGAEFEETLSQARRIEERPHQIKFTHGDFKAHNILVGDDGHLSGLIDWESAGWYPEYWEFTTAMRFGRNSWWYQVASFMGGDQYLPELKADIALNLLTVDSYIFF